MHHDPALTTFWITFPRDPHLPIGVGVTAYSEEDAFSLIAEQGIDVWWKDAREIKVERDIRIEKLLCYKTIAPNMGPIQLRGVWYPCMNIGYGAPTGRQFRKFDEASSNGKRRVR